MGLFKLGNYGAGRIGSDMGREAQTAQMDSVKATYRIMGRVLIRNQNSNSSNGGVKYRSGTEAQTRMEIIILYSEHSPEPDNQKGCST